MKRTRECLHDNRWLICTTLIAFVYSITFAFNVNAQTAELSIEAQFDTLLAQARSATDSTLAFAQEAYRLGKDQDSLNWQIKALHAIDDYHYSRYNFQETANALTELARLYQKKGDILKEGKMYTYLCMPLRNLAKFDSMNFYFEKGIQLAKTHDLPQLEADLYLQMSDYYNLGLRDHETAVEFLMKSLPYKMKGELNKVALSRVYHDLGKNYIQLDEPDSTRKYATLALKVAEDIGRPSIIEITNALMADFLEREGEFAAAAPYAAKAMKLSEEIGNKEAIAFNSMNLVEINLKLNKLGPENIQYLNSALDIIEHDTLNSQLANLLYLKSRFYEETGNLTEALSVYKKATKAQTDRDKYIAKQDLEAVELKKNAEKQKQELEYLDAENKSNKRMLWLLGALALLSLISGLTLWNRNKLKFKLNTEENERLKAEKERDEAEMNRLLILQKTEKEKTEDLQQKLETNQRELVATTLYISKKNELLQNINQEILKASSNDLENNKLRIANVHQMIERNLVGDDDWTVFKSRFEQVHPNFFKSLQTDFDSFTPNETKLLAYIKMGMDTVEIANLAGVNPTSIHKARYRLRKKLNLSEGINLESFIGNLN